MRSFSRTVMTSQWAAEPRGSTQQTRDALITKRFCSVRCVYSRVHISHPRDDPFFTSAHHFPYRDHLDLFRHVLVVAFFLFLFCCFFVLFLPNQSPVLFTCSEFAMLLFFLLLQCLEVSPTRANPHPFVDYLINNAHSYDRRTVALVSVGTRSGVRSARLHGTVLMPGRLAACAVVEPHPLRLLSRPCVPSPPPRTPRRVRPMHPLAHQRMRPRLLRARERPRGIPPPFRRARRRAVWPPHTALPRLPRRCHPPPPHRLRHQQCHQHCCPQSPRLRCRHQRHRQLHCQAMPPLKRSLETTTAVAVAVAAEAAMFSPPRRLNPPHPQRRQRHPPTVARSFRARGAFSGRRDRAERPLGGVTMSTPFLASALG